MTSSPDSSTIEPHSTAVEEPEDVQLQPSSQEPPSTSSQESQPTPSPQHLDTHTPPPSNTDTLTSSPSQLDTQTSPPSQLDTHTSPPSQPTPSSSHLPTFITALSLKPKHPPINGAQTGAGDADNGSQGPSDSHTDNVCSEEEKMDTSLSQESLAAKFKQDPGSVLDLLQAAVSVDKLTSLLQQEYRGDKQQLQTLQSKLEDAYKTLKECGEQKETLTTHIEETNDKIRNKRKHLESLREELRVLGEEEAQLKKRRDASYTKCSELKKKLKASREALQQISVLGASNKQTSDSYDSKKTTA